MSLLRSIVKPVETFLKRGRQRPPKVDRFVVQFKRQFSGRTFVVQDEPQRVNLLVAAVDPGNFFGGYLAMYNVGKRFAELGYQVRILVVDHPQIDPDDLEKVRKHDRLLQPFLAQVEFVLCHSREQVIPISERDLFVATSFCSAHLASEAVRHTVYDKFIYLTQEYEPIFFDNCAYRVLAEQSYTLNYFPIVSTELLQRFYLQQGIFHSENPGVAFNNPVLSFDLAEDFGHRRGDKKKLLFYARTQPHNNRNLYPIGCLVLDRVRELGYFRDEEWEVIGIGAGVGEQLLPSGLRIRHIGKFDMQRYQELLPQHDLGLSLMFSPHPSLLPIEMAAAGLRVVTNTCDIKDQAYFAGISSNIRAVAPQIETLAQALIEEAQRVDDYPARLAGSRVNWPQSWDAALPASLVAQAVQAVTAGPRS